MTIKIGDRIKFKSLARWNSKAAVRVVNGFDAGRPMVRFGGYPEFIVRPDEVIEVVS